MSEHFIIRCSCGTIISQCKCFGPRIETTVEAGCDECHKDTIQLSKKGDAWGLRVSYQNIILTDDELKLVHVLIEDLINNEQI